ncbi:hypothetical protein CRM22_003300 [Opisthorchis felineus]|uniref:Rubicon Homology domain-containing protein n=1 Tax=Opisthorchis felineus TaxID=147828 RepID=A0A4S2M2I9_OPIFE|nr:hypothetical protein CRM22_003300 [Opisthorchis felineus]TGZ70266.1 hypothetical protein CRM22_003300 [Opisthorchis felineus]
MNLSRNSLAKRRVTNETIPRYFLHHHSPDHYQNRPMSALRQHMSFSSVQHLMKSRTNQRNNSFDATPKHMDDHLLRRGSRSTTLLNQPNETVENLMNSASTVVQHTRGHDLVQATCSRLRLPCETCQHTVHGHHYLYCQHCPLVVHRKELCVTALPRGCPSVDLGIKGWGEGRQTIKWMDAAEVNLEDVYLSANLALQSNKCYECRRVLSKSAGHELEQEGDVKRVNDTKEVHANHQLPKSIGKAVVHKIAKVHSHKQPGIKKNDSSHSLNLSTEIRVCHLTGRYYCDNCHWDDQWYIPGSIVLLNDTSKQPMDVLSAELSRRHDLNHKYAGPLTCASEFSGIPRLSKYRNTGTRRMKKPSKSMPYGQNSVTFCLTPTSAPLPPQSKNTQSCANQHTCSGIHSIYGCVMSLTC